MKRSAILIFGILILSTISSLLMSKASMAGKTGMSLFYREYNFLKYWWKGALLVFTLLMIIYIIQGLIQRNKIFQKKRSINVIAIAMAIAGFFFTYLDFSNTLSHSLLGGAFHTGVYLFWIGWIGISTYFLTNNRSFENYSIGS